MYELIHSCYYVKLITHREILLQTVKVMNAQM